MKKHCTMCGQPVDRLLVDRGDADLEYGRHVNFTPDPAGAWIRDPLYGHMRRVGKTAITNLDRYAIHRCDDPALD